MKLFNLKRLKNIGLTALMLTTSIHGFNVHAESKNGKALFETTCAACHGKNLKGGAGFNLKDETWVHGSQPEQVLANIKKGFSEAGMPGFSAVYNDKQLKSIVDYILSKREGLDNLTYKIYHINSDTPQSFDVIKDLPVAKSGRLTTNLIDFSLPEVNDYIIEFEADLYAPVDEEAQIFSMTYKEFFQVEIDGEIVEPSLSTWLRWAWPIKQGKQHLKLRYSTIGTPAKSDKRFKFFVANKNLTQKIFGISTPGKQFLNKATYNISPDTKDAVVRKKIVKLPISSVAVGTPLKVNYAFNTKTCALVGVWTGDFLNIGPNIEGRGRDGSLIGGEWIFHEPARALPITADNRACEFIKYNRATNTTFTYGLGEQKYTFSAIAQNTSTLILNYTLVTGTDSALMVNLPRSDKFTFSSKQGSITDNQFSVNAKVGHTYQVVLSILGNN